ncbi:putative serine protease K12H4.7 [Grifola frondosa]|uniref:Putative serine protease K12H4.7 n=1 Tax=Grifola frondosa TaxID=5627 RepID=A0A1C7LL29_GRIFR|nr:putative serine protease K12H4.7 [Grifola frondosa]
MKFLYHGIGLLFLARLSFAITPDGRIHANRPPRPSIPKLPLPPTDTPVASRNGTQLPPYNMVYYFDQLIDHNNPSAGTFQQRYWHTYEFYESGGPIILSTPGEVAADAYYTYLTNSTINGQIAQQLSGSTIVLEHRFFGESNPHSDLSVTSLRVHTIQQAIDDFEYFANNVQLPMPNGNAVAPGKAPWILIGGSYAGALTAYTMVNKPGLFEAGYASSAVVQAMVDYWGYFEPIMQHMPANCSADVQAVIAQVDSVLNSGNTNSINSLKEMFGVSNLSHLDDFAAVLRNNLFDWQSLQPTSGPGGAFYQFCDALEVKNGVSAGASGWGLTHALQAWGSYWTNTYIPSICGGLDAEDCLGTYDSTNPSWTNTAIPNAERSWEWLVCNQFGFFYDGPPAGQPAIVSRLVQPAYDERHCAYMFPGAFNSSTPTPNATGTIAAYGGWNISVDRLMFANGQRDPWLEATVGAAGTLAAKTTGLTPHALSDGFHCSDLLTRSNVDPSIKNVQANATMFMVQWIASWVPSA